MSGTQAPNDCRAVSYEGPGGRGIWDGLTPGRVQLLPTRQNPRVFDWMLRSLSDDVTPGDPFLHVGVAQWTEQEISNLPVAGSNPSVGSIFAGQLSWQSVGVITRRSPVRSRFPQQAAASAHGNRPPCTPHAGDGGKVTLPNADLLLILVIAG